MNSTITSEFLSSIDMRSRNSHWKNKSDIVFRQSLPIRSLLRKPFWDFQIIIPQRGISTSLLPNNQSLLEVQDLKTFEKVLKGKFKNLTSLSRKLKLILNKKSPKIKWTTWSYKKVSLSRISWIRKAQLSEKEDEICILMENESFQYTITKIRWPLQGKRSNCLFKIWKEGKFMRWVLI